MGNQNGVDTPKKKWEIPSFINLDDCDGVTQQDNGYVRFQCQGYKHDFMKVGLDKDGQIVFNSSECGSINNTYLNHQQAAALILKLQSIINPQQNQNQ